MDQTRVPTSGRTIDAVILPVLLAALLASSCAKAPAPTRSVQQPAEPAPQAAPAAAGLARLVGRWQRIDGGYVLEIRSVAPDGALDASYLNPRPIHVSMATASWWRGAAEVFIELNDVNYPGSSYRLTYRPEDDVLHGTYFQAIQKQTFEVIFVRMQ